MEIYELKMKIRKNKALMKILKFMYKPIGKFQLIPSILKEYKTIKGNLNSISKTEKKILFVGIPLHPNLGDQAQYYCITKWLKENYPNNKILEMADCLINSNYLHINNKVKKIINEDDIIIFQSGYRTTDVANKQGEYAHRKIIEQYPNNKILVFPQTVNFKDKKESENSKQSYSKGKKVLFLARDKISYKTAQKTYKKNTVELYPDIVTSLIGSYKFNNKRNGILCCMRRDAEKLYENSDIEVMMNELKKVCKVDRNDTTISISYKDLRENLKQIIENQIETFSKYKVTITDRYHGTIFSLISNTPTIVISSTDHKLSSGVEWFKNIKEFTGYIFFAKNLKEAQELAIKIYKENKEIKELPSYFNENYYKKLKGKFEAI